MSTIFSDIFNFSICKYSPKGSPSQIVAKAKLSKLSDKLINLQNSTGFMDKERKLFEFFEI